MRRKRLQHHADTLCQMFCGWQLLSDYEAITEMNCGLLEIDVLTRRCRHNGIPIEPLGMAHVLSSWMREDLIANNIPLDAVKEATLQVEFERMRHRGQKNRAVRWTRPSKEFISCNLKCSSIVATDEKEYIGQYSEVEKWPTNYGT